MVKDKGPTAAAVAVMRACLLGAVCVRVRRERKRCGGRGRAGAGMRSWDELPLTSLARA